MPPVFLIQFRGIATADVRQASLLALSELERQYASELERQYAFELERQYASRYNAGMQSVSMSDSPPKGQCSFIL